MSDVAFVDRAVSEITYYNIVFADHQVFCANGLPVESYLPDPARLDDLDDLVSRDLTALFSREEATPQFPEPRYAALPGDGYRPELV